VSGWDSRENFFVENCDLLWTDEAGKHVRLNHKLDGCAVVFVRLLDSSDPERAHPVVYRAEWLGKAQNGMNQFYLRTIAPRIDDPEDLIE
jgi:hypothetical protein